MLMEVLVTTRQNFGKYYLCFIKYTSPPVIKGGVKYETPFKIASHVYRMLQYVTIFFTKVYLR